VEKGGYWKKRREKTHKRKRKCFVLARFYVAEKFAKRVGRAEEKEGGK